MLLLRAVQFCALLPPCSRIIVMFLAPFFCRCSFLLVRTMSTPHVVVETDDSCATPFPTLVRSSPLLFCCCGCGLTLNAPQDSDLSILSVLWLCCGCSCCQYQEPRGGAAVFSAGTTTFHGRAYFLANGQYQSYAYDNEDGGAVSNSGSMMVRHLQA